MQINCATITKAPKTNNTTTAPKAFRAAPVLKQLRLVIFIILVVLPPAPILVSFVPKLILRTIAMIRDRSHYHHHSHHHQHHRHSSLAAHATTDVKK